MPDPQPRYFGDDFLDQVQQLGGDSTAIAEASIEEFQSLLEHDVRDPEAGLQRSYDHAATFLVAFNHRYSLIEAPDISGSDFGALSTAYDLLKRVIIKQALDKRLDSVFGGTIATLTDDDLANAQTLIAQLREVLTTSNEIEDAHKQRLLRKLEDLQQELHKHISGTTSVCPECGGDV